MIQLEKKIWHDPPLSVQSNEEQHFGFQWRLETLYSKVFDKWISNWNLSRSKIVSLEKKKRKLFLIWWRSKLFSNINSENKVQLELIELQRSFFLRTGGSRLVLEWRSLVSGYTFGLALSWVWTHFCEHWVGKLSKLKWLLFQVWLKLVSFRQDENFFIYRYSNCASYTIVFLIAGLHGISVDVTVEYYWVMMFEYPKRILFNGSPCQGWT